MPLTAHVRDAASAGTAGRRAVPVAAVDVLDPTWQRRQRRVREVTLPTQTQHMERDGYFEALTLAWQPGDLYTPHIFWESDLAKWIEAASYCLAAEPDPELEAEVDRVIALLASAQQPDGYLNAYFTVVAPELRFTDHEDAHELYCAGHLIEAAVAHAEATGKHTLLDVVLRYADLIDRRFAPGGPDEGGYDGHPEIELALVRLYRATGEKRYLDLSRRLLDNRGRSPSFFVQQRQRRGTHGHFASVFPGRAELPERYSQYQQSHRPVRQQVEAVGHAVRAVYLYTAMSDVALLTGDAEMLQASQTLWRDITERKMYVTGSIGSEPAYEAFGPAFHLPNSGGYGETCAAIGLANWSRRLGDATGEGRYWDVVERCLYNGILSGSSADGTDYFYGNPLSSDGGDARSPWFDTSCCPPNLARFIASLGSAIYSVRDGEIAVNLLIGSSTEVDLPGGGAARLTLETEYPREGRVSLLVDVDVPTELTIAVRIPAWCPTVTVGDDVVRREDLEDGFLTLRRPWGRGEGVELDLELVTERVRSHQAVLANRGLVAFQRGPVVYCAEEIDHGVPTSSLVVRSSATPVVVDVIDGLPVLAVDGAVAEPAHTLYDSSPPILRPLTVRLVPYQTWGNRGTGSMDVWLRDQLTSPL